MSNKQPNSTLPWVEKYRPKSLNEVVYHSNIIHLLRHFISTQEMPHLFFYGPPGTGKTSTILSCAKEIYGKAASMMVLHLNASDERGIDVVRKQIIQFASTSALFHVNTNMAKFVILDEADSMTRVAQLALRDIMIQYDTLFCLIGNYKYAFHPSLQSRMIHLLFTPIPLNAAVNIATTILDTEEVEYKQENLEKIYKKTRGDMRQFVNTLQALNMREPKSFVSNDINKLLYHDECKGDELLETLFEQKTLKECYDFLTESVVISHALTLSNWIDILTTGIVDYSQKYAIHHEDNFSDLLQICIDISHIEHNSSVVLQPEVQLFSLVATVHKYVTDINSRSTSVTNSICA